MAASGVAIEKWHVDAVAWWLDQAGLSELVPAFRSHGIDVALLLLMDDTQLLELGVSSKLQVWLLVAPKQ
jgi:hypothetical protein